MTNKNNELPSFVNETNLPKIVDKLTDASNIKIANNKYGNRVQTVIDKIVEKADDVTKAIKQEVVNDSYSFKVGTGDVDVSSDVEDGFGEVGVKGITYQNLWFGTVGSANITNGVYTPPEYTGECRANSDCGFTIDTDMIKPNIDYTVIFDVKCEVVGILPKVMLFDKGTLSNPKSFNLTNIDATTFKTIVLKIRTDKNGCKILVGFNAGGQEVKGAQMVVKNIIILEGDHTNNPNLPSYFEGIVGVGDKSKNLFNPKSVKFGINLNTNTGEEMNSNVYVTSDFIPVLEKTDYTVKGLPVIHYYNESKEQIAVKNTPVEGVIRTPQNCKWIRMRNYDQILITEQKLLIKKSSFILGTYDTFEPYYEGHKIEILSHGKNLVKPTITYNNNKFDTILVSTINQCLYLNGIKEQGKSPGDSLFTNSTDYFYLKPNTKYIVSRKIFSGESNLCMLAFRLENVTTGTIQWLNTGSGENCVINASSDIRRVSYFRIYHDPDFKIEYKNVVVGAMMEEVKEQQTTRSNYEPYVEDKTQILLDEPLMRLPNGVCDEITRDGKLIRRVGKVILDGNEKEIWLNNIRDGRTQFVLHNAILTNPSLSIYQNGNAWCDTLPVIPNDNPIRAIWVYEKNNIVIQLPVEIADTIDKLRAWLSQNPTTVYYELSTPIITELPAPCLRIFKDGHLTFNTLVAPESTHVVQLNKSAQIQNAIKESQSLDNRINVLENNYDNLMLSTISRLNELELNYILK